MNSQFSEMTGMTYLKKTRTQEKKPHQFDSAFESAFASSRSLSKLFWPVRISPGSSIPSLAKKLELKTRSI